MWRLSVYYHIRAEKGRKKPEISAAEKPGRELVQGYYFYRPLPAEAFERKYLK